MIKDNEQAGEGACNKKMMRRKGGRDKKQKGRRYPPEFRRRAVMMHVEGGHSQCEVARQLEVPLTTLSHWLMSYKRHGDGAALFRSSPPPAGGGDDRPRLPAPVREKIVALKQANGRWGVRRIAQVMYRWFLMKVSPESVRQTLHKENLIEPVVRRPKRNPGKPRFFERATPNQMWQSDIFCFRLGGNNAYLIAFMDDYSRFIVGIELFRSQTAQSVLEVYRRAVSEYGTPKEMLTDNGRQYATWRGKTRFQMELAKDRIAHIRSQPHHPMTLGKVERFWSSIWGEFLGRAQFDDFEAGPRPDPPLGPVLQPQAAPSGPRRPLPGGPLLRNPERAAQDPRTGHPRQRAGNGPARPPQRALLHGRTHARPVRRAPRREGQTQTPRR